MKKLLCTLLLSLLSSKAYSYTNVTDIIDSDTFCMAINMYHEARNQGELGMRAVGHVVLNRQLSTKFPRRIDGKIVVTTANGTAADKRAKSTICDIVYDAKLDYHDNPIKHQCNFSWYCDGLSDSIGDRESWRMALRIADQLISTRDKHYDFTDGALYYHTTEVEPYWLSAFEQTIIVRDHIFYK